MTLLFATPSAWAEKTILIFGDSLSAGYGIRPEKSWPALLQQRLKEKRLDYSVANLSISGETSAGGRSRMAAALEKTRPTVVILALGTNDGLRGLPLSQMQDNLAAMLTAASRSGARPLLVGMLLPPNYGPYAGEFQQVFSTLAKSSKTPLVPFLLAGIAEQPAFFQPDMLHPTAEAQPRLLDNIWPSLEALLK